MPWNERLREAAYTSPGGARLTFLYEDVSKTFEKRGEVFDFPDAPGSYVQDMGRSGFRFPLRMIFSGADYDLAAQAFEDALSEPGIGKLEHPVYGTFDVIPNGEVRRRDDLVREANQAIIECTFFETIGLVYPTPQADPASGVTAAVEEYNVAASEEFAQAVDTDAASWRVTLANGFEGLVGKVNTVLGPIAETQENIRNQFETIVSSVTSSIDELIQKPLTLARQTALLIQAPGRAITNITDKIRAYGTLIADIIFGPPDDDEPAPIAVVPGPGNDPINSNTFHLQNLFASTEMTGSIISVINHQFTTKPEALAAAEVIQQQFVDLTEWRDLNYSALEQVDTGESYQKLQEATALAIGFLVQISFTLKQERRFFTARAHTCIDLAAELYGSVDDQLDFFISSNELSGAEILEIPAGREIVFYV